MRRVPLIAFVTVLAGGVLAARQGISQAGGQDPTFRAGTHEVSVYATVFDNTGRLVPNLAKEDFEVFDDGKRQDLILFSNDVQPITVVVMLDRSGSMVSNFTLERDAAVQFVSHLIPADRARIGSFSNRVQIDPETFTGDHDEMIRILHQNLLEAGVTPLWNATSAAMTALAHVTGRRVVLLFTDGFDNPDRAGSFHATFAEVHERSQAEEIMIYAVGLADACSPAPVALGTGAGAPRYQGYPPRGGIDRPVPSRGVPEPPNPLFPGRGTPGPGVSIPLDRLLGKGKGDTPCSGGKPDPGLKDLAADGGGGYFELQHSDDLAATFARIADELHHQYLLAFAPTKFDGRKHVLEVRVRRPNVTVRARASYVATLGK